MCKCYVTDFPKNIGPTYAQVNNLYDLGVEEQHLVAPKKRAAVMKRLIPVMFYAIIKYVNFEGLKECCYGCLCDLENQEAHSCVSWEGGFRDSVLKKMCSKLDMQKYLHHVITLAIALDCLSLNIQHLVLGSQIQQRILSSNFPSNTVSLLIKPSDKIYLNYAEKLVSGVRYDYFLNFCDDCVVKK